MARDADFDVDLFAEIVRTGAGPRDAKVHSLTESTRDNGNGGPGAKRRGRTSD